MIGKSNKGISTTIALIGMVTLLVVGIGIGYVMNSGGTDTSAEFPQEAADMCADTADYIVTLASSA